MFLAFPACGRHCLRKNDLFGVERGETQMRVSLFYSRENFYERFMGFYDHFSAVYDHSNDSMIIQTVL